jgi:hypothetical protein
VVGSHKVPAPVAAASEDTEPARCPDCRSYETFDVACEAHKEHPCEECDCRFSMHTATDCIDCFSFKHRPAADAHHHYRFQGGKPVPTSDDEMTPCPREALWAGLGNHGEPAPFERAALDKYEAAIRAPLEARIEALEAKVYEEAWVTAEEHEAVTAERDEALRLLDTTTAAKAWSDIRAERDRWQPLSDEIEAARAKYPGNNHRLLALQGEVNEVLHAYVTGDAEKVRAEVLQVAATAMRLYEEGDSALRPPAPATEEVQG